MSWHTLRPADIARLAGLRAPGFVRHFSLAGRSREDARRWNLDDAANTIKGVSGAAPLGFDLVFSERQTSLGAWAPTWERLEPWIQQWQLQNPHLLEYRPATPYPPLAAGQVFQLCKVVPFRATKYPIETRFSSSGEGGNQSPLVQLCNAVPVPEPGTTVYVQVLWCRDATPFSLAFLPQMELFAQGRDAQALQEKKAERYTYRVQVRVLALYKDLGQARRLDYGRAVGEAFRLWDRANANRLVAKRFPLAAHAKAVRLLEAMWARRLPWAWESHLNRKPHYTKDELAALVHPVPAGATVLRIPQLDVRAHIAPHSMVDLNKTVRRGFQDWLHGNPAAAAPASVANALTAAQVRQALNRQGLAEGADAA